MEIKRVKENLNENNTFPAFLTIIVPAYNVERFLAQCLDSLLHQTMMAHKVIIVNDGSTDSTGTIARHYSDEHPELFLYIEQENRGLGAARNRGMQDVQTEFVTFLDSDDWLMPRYVELLFKRLQEENEVPELIFTLPRIYDMATNTFEPWMDKSLFYMLFPTSGTVISSKTDPRIYALEPNACRRVYSTSFLKQVDFAFPEGTKWEDVEPHFQLLHLANRCIGEGNIGFCYRINSGGQITTSIGPDRLQVVSVFSRAFNKALQESWDGIELSYILKMMTNFMEWCINCSSVPVRKQLVEKVHDLYNAVPNERFRNFYKDIHLARKQRLYVELLRSPFYKVVKNEHYFKVFRGVMKRIIRKA